MSDPAWDFEKFRKSVAAPAATEPAAGTRFGRYRLVRKIARGAAGAVFEAEDVDLGRPVALKILHEVAGLSDVARQRFQREAKSAARLAHPNIVQVHDTGEEDGRPYLVMELVEGRPLSEILGRREFELRRLLGLLEKVARAVGAAHDAGIVHRDLKPANIMVTDGGEPKVADFGLAHWLDSDTALTKTGAPLGTPLYMAPEQVRGGGAVTPASDVYALGAILFEMLAGRPPHAGDSSAELFYRIVHEEPASPRKFESRVPRDLETVCLKALEKEPGRRYPSAASFADELRRFLNGESILARPPGPAVRAWKWSRRHPAVAAALLMALVAAATAVAGSRILRDREVGRFLAGGRAARDERERLSKTLEGLLRSRGEVERGLDPSAPDKGKLWEIDLEIEETRRAAADAGARMIASFTRAVGRDPSCEAARTALAEHFWSEFLRAEEAADWSRAAECRQYVELYAADGPERFNRPGLISIATQPSPAEIFIFRYEVSPDLRRVPRPFDLRISAGTGPLPLDGSLPCGEVNRVGPSTAVVQIAAGSYLLLIRAAGFRDVRYPVLVDRGGRQEIRVALPREQDIGADFVFIPGGPFVRGGDPEAIDSPPREVATVGDFCIGRHEVTTGEYFAFISDYAARDPEAAWQRVPRTGDVTASGERLLWTRDPATGAIRPAGGMDFPISGITGEDADDYCAWLTDRAKARGDRRVFRLPTDREWEKAARGADGRFFPWGDHFDWSFTMGSRSFDAETVRRLRGWTLGPVGSFPKDESPWGVMDMGGSNIEWCSTWHDESRHLRDVRGGGWKSTHERIYRSASPKWADPRGSILGYGFRVAFTPDRSW